MKDRKGKDRKYNISLKGRLRKKRYQSSRKARFTYKKWYGRTKMNKYRDLLDIQNGKCYYCNAEINENNISIDHKQPLSKEGSRDIANLVVTCWICNRAKNDMTEIEYCEWLNFIKYQALIKSAI